MDYFHTNARIEYITIDSHCIEQSGEHNGCIYSKTVSLKSHTQAESASSVICASVLLNFAWYTSRSSHTPSSLLPIAPLVHPRQVWAIHPAPRGGGVELPRNTYFSVFFFFLNSDQGGKLSKHKCLLCKNLTRPRTHHQRMIPFPCPETEVQMEMMKNIGPCYRSASSRRAQGSGRTYPPQPCVGRGPKR